MCTHWIVLDYNKKGTAQGGVSLQLSHHGILLTEIKHDMPQSFRMIQRGRWTCNPEAPSSRWICSQCSQVQLLDHPCKIAMRTSWVLNLVMLKSPLRGGGRGKSWLHTGYTILSTYVFFFFFFPF